MHTRLRKGPVATGGAPVRAGGPVLMGCRMPAGALVDEGDAGGDIGIAPIDAPPATAVQAKVHLGDDEPAAAEHLLDMRDMAAATGALNARLEYHGGPHCWCRAGAQAIVRRIPRPGRGVAELEEQLVLVTVPGVPGADPEVAAIGGAREV